MAKRILQYGELARYYDTIYQWKDYHKEAEVIRELIARYKASPGNSLLDVGCGTGKHLQEVKGRFGCVGMDVSREMLEQARRNVDGVEFIQGDMVDFDLGRRFDVILCLFSSIGYVKTYARLARTLRNFAAHLLEGGVVIIEPWFTKSTIKAGHIHVLAQGDDNLKIVRVDYTDVKGSVSILDERIVIAERNRGIAVYKDRMTMGLFEQEEFLRLMAKTGLKAEYLKRSLAPGRGLYVGVKRRPAGVQTSARKMLEA